MTHLKPNEQIGIYLNREGLNGLTVEQFRDFIFEQINTIASMDMIVQTSQIFNDTTFEVINGFDNVSIDNDLIVPDTANNTITVLENAIYQLSGGLSLAFGPAEQLGVMWFVNDVIINPNPVLLQGGGSVFPVTVSWEAIITLQENDIITMKAININAGNLTGDMKAMFFTAKRIG